jgi:pimeloyl-ACP methyl ester carboxylesterase
MAKQRTFWICVVVAASAAGACRTSDQEARTMIEAMKMQVDVKGEGAGTPLVLVGGGLTGWKSWEPHQARLAGTRRVARAQPLAVQLGLEDRPLPADYSVKQESAALGRGLDAAGLDGRIDLVAWSYGAAIALDFALDHPERIATLALIEPPAMWVLDATDVLDEQARRERDEMRALYAQMRGDVTEQQLASFVTQAGLSPPGVAPRALPAWASWVEHRRSLRTGDAVWLHSDRAARLRAFPRPVLLVRGHGSAHVLHRIVDGLAATLPHHSTLELPGGHAPQLVAMDDFLARLAAFQAAP